MFTITVNFENVFKGLAKATETIKSGSAIKSAIPELVDERKKRVESGVNEYGRRLHPLAPSTIKRKGNDRVLVESGELKNGLRMQVKSGLITMSLASSSRSKKLYYAMKGTGTQPPRPFAGANVKDVGIILKHLGRAVLWFR